MIAVLVLPGPNPGMFGLDEYVPLSMLPLGDRPFLQHIVEFLVLQDIKTIEFVMEYLPERVERYFGDGTRWGAKFRYHLVSQVDATYRPLTVLTPPEDEPWLLAHGDRFGFAPYRTFAKPTSVIAFTREHSGGHQVWSGVAVFPNWRLAGQVANLTPEELAQWLRDESKSGAVQPVEVSRWISVESPSELLENQRKLLHRELPDLMMGGFETDSGVWISRNVVIHPSVKIAPPVYLGPNSRLGEGVRIGPNTVVSGSCILDKHTSAVESLITAGTYVGQGLELDRAIVQRQLLVNTQLNTGVKVREDFLLGGITEANRDPFSRFVHILIAAALLLLLSPLIVAGLLFLPISGRRFRTIEIIRTPAPSDSSRWQPFSLLTVDCATLGQRTSGFAHLFGRFLPGLLSVLRGDLALVGLPPRTEDELNSLDPDWQNLALAHPGGLVTEAGVVLDNASESTDAYLADAVYVATKSWRHDASLLGSYALLCLGGKNCVIQNEGDAGEV